MTNKQFNLLSGLITDKLGFYFPKSKKNILHSKVVKRMNYHSIDNLNDYINILFDSGENLELTHFLNLITINKTSFYRERTQICNIIKEIRHNHSNRKIKHKFKILSAGCSSGEEPYSLATEILFNNMLKKDDIDFSIIATDINTEMLEYANKGIYPISQSQQIPIERRKHFLLRGESNGKECFTFKEEVKSKITFIKNNLITSDINIHNNFDFVSCCNVLIYFTKEIQNIVLNRFSNILVEDGYLIIGLSESIHLLQSNYTKTKSGMYKLLQLA